MKRLLSIAILLLSATSGFCCTASKVPNNAPVIVEVQAAESRSNAEAGTVAALSERALAELGPGFSLRLVRERYVVASNARASSLDRAISTLENVHDALYAELLETPRESALAIYLFRDADSYDAYNLRAYGELSSTPYGFYMASEAKIVMNIATGTGTLAHELAHPLLEADFPGIPAWFNEGLASLLEQSQTVDGKIRGLVNWRLTGLQQHFASGAEQLLATVMNSSTAQFYGEDSGSNYAVARYLCMYLQEHGLLEAYYRAFRQSVNDDPSGVESLQTIVGLPLDEIEKAWKDWAAGLRFDG